MTRADFTERIIVGILIIALIILMAVYSRLNPSGSDHFRVHIAVPWGLIAIFISLYLFREYNRAKKAKRANRREYMNAHRQELLDKLLKKNKKSTP